MSLLPKIKLSFAIVVLGLIGFSTPPAALAKTADIPAMTSALAQDAGCMQHTSHANTGRKHACCDQNADQSCPDDMDCDGICNAVCASAVFLTAAPMANLHQSKASVYQHKSIQLFAFQTTLNAPPPRS
ncbi:MAG: hypothetical protein Q9M33_00370 [Robiginitomaculum sp.]|nr:hypothetical protein [Robiginitomaculum sp.]MDQ7078750.1 hypothetical protein [Robiginitomaculum sp.]